MTTTSDPVPQVTTVVQNFPPFQPGLGMVGRPVQYVYGPRASSEAYLLAAVAPNPNAGHLDYLPPPQFGQVLAAIVVADHGNGSVTLRVFRDDNELPLRVPYIAHDPSGQLQDTWRHLA